MKEGMREILKEYGNMMYNLNCSYEFLKDKEEFSEVINTKVFKKMLDAMFKDLDNLLKNLDERKKRILILRYGLNGDKPKFIREIAEMENLSISRIRTIITKTLRRIENDFEKIQNKGFN